MAVPLEYFIRTLITEYGAWVVGVFDCHRERAILAMCGGDNAKIAVEEIPVKNVLLSFNCQPNICRRPLDHRCGLLRQLKRFFNPPDGSVILPPKIPKIFAR